MKKSKIALLFCISVMLPMLLSAQGSDVEMADTLRSNGKIFVVIGVIGIILFGILIFLLLIDKKVRNLEKSQKK